MLVPYLLRNSLEKGVLLLLLLLELGVVVSVCVMARLARSAGPCRSKTASSMCMSALECRPACAKIVGTPVSCSTHQYTSCMHQTNRHITPPVCWTSRVAWLLLQ